MTPANSEPTQLDSFWLNALLFLSAGHLLFDLYAKALSDSQCSLSCYLADLVGPLIFTTAFYLRPSQSSKRFFSRQIPRYHSRLLGPLYTLLIAHALFKFLDTFILRLVLLTRSRSVPDVKETLFKVYRLASGAPQGVPKAVERASESVSKVTEQATETVVTSASKITENVAEALKEALSKEEGISITKATQEASGTVFGSASSVKDEL